VNVFAGDKMFNGVIL